MTSIADKIKDSHLLTEIFGRWPSFHDAEVLSIDLNRGDEEKQQPTLKARIHVFEMTSEVDSRGYFVLRHHTRATLVFRGIEELSMNGFNGQNVLWDLEITDIESSGLEFLKFEVCFPTSFGLEAQFKCGSIEIESVEPMHPRVFSPPAKISS